MGLILRRGLVQGIQSTVNGLYLVKAVKIYAVLGHILKDRQRVIFHELTLSS